MAGSAREASGTWTLDGSGANIWNTSDEFRFAYQAVTGDVDIRVRVASLEEVNDWSKAGVMIRESLAANARNAFMFVTPGGGRAFQRRSQDGRFDDAHAPGVREPRRSGCASSGRAVNSPAICPRTARPGHRPAAATISMTSSVYVGLAVSSRVDSTLATATFTNVQVGTGSGTTPASAGAVDQW